LSKRTIRNFKQNLFWAFGYNTLGISIAIIADIIDAGHFKASKMFASCLMSASKVANSNMSVSIRGTNKQERKLSATLLTQGLNHVLNAIPKLNRRHERLAEYKEAGLVRTGLRRRVFAEIYQMLKKEDHRYGMEAQKHEVKMSQYLAFLKKHEKTKNMQIRA
jgi:hypothetical protein